MIEFKSVTKRFGPKVVLDKVSFHIKKGEIVFIIGKSGVGKSVLLKTIVGLLPLSSGEIWLDEKKISGMTENQYDTVRRRCGMVFQNPALLDSLSVYDNIAFGLRATKKKENEIQAKVNYMLREVNLPEKVLSMYPADLSFGMQKRVSFARTLAGDPDYCLFDEPTTGQDPVTTNLLNQNICRLSKDLKVTSVVVSHDMHCALDIADRIFMLSEGKIIASGPVKDLLESTEPLVHAFLKEAKAHRFKETHDRDHK